MIMRMMMTKILATIMITINSKNSNNKNNNKSNDKHDLFCLKRNLKVRLTKRKAIEKKHYNV